MSDKQTKRPAHEVIMEEIKIVLGELESGLAGEFPARLTALFDVLGKMIIHDRHREEVVKELVSLQARYAVLWEKGNNVWLTPASFPKLIRRLNDEHEAGKEAE